MRHAILLIYDEPEKKLVNVPCEDLLIRLLDKILSMKSMEARELDCFCMKNNSIDRAKTLIRYLRKHLKFRKDQITFLRASRFKNSHEVRMKLKSLFRKHQSDDVLFYYAGHGITGPTSGWSLGKEKFIYYRSLTKILKEFQGKLVFINNCCHGLAVNPHLKFLSGKYLLLGASRRGCLSAESILDPILGYWFHSKVAEPKVQHTGKLNGNILDIPAYATRGSYYHCGCGSKFTLLKTFVPSNAPSLRRGSELDSVWFPEK